MTSQKVIGAIYPITTSQTTRFFDEGKTVFVKFTNMTNFKANSKIIFYVKGENALFGEGTIRIINKMSPPEAWSKFNKELFLNQDEYEKYTSWSSVEKKNRVHNQMWFSFSRT